MEPARPWDLRQVLARGRRRRASSSKRSAKIEEMRELNRPWTDKPVIAAFLGRIIIRRMIIVKVRTGSEIDIFEVEYSSKCEPLHHHIIPTQ